MEAIFIILKILAYLFLAGLFLLFCWFILINQKNRNFKRNLIEGTHCKYYQGESENFGIIKEINGKSVTILNYFSGEITKPISEIYPI